MFVLQFPWGFWLFGQLFFFSVGQAWLGDSWGLEVRVQAVSIWGTLIQTEIDRFFEVPAESSVACKVAFLES